MRAADNGHNLVPEPPEIITGIKIRLFMNSKYMDVTNSWGACLNIICYRNAPQIRLRPPLLRMISVKGIEAVEVYIGNGKELAAPRHIFCV